MVVCIRDAGAAGARRLAEVIRQAGCHVGVVTTPGGGDDHAKAGEEVDRLVEIGDVSDPDLLAQAVAQVSAGFRLGAILVSSDGHLAAASVASERLGLDRTPSAPILIGRNKFVSRAVLAEAGLPTPRYALLSSVDQVPRVAAEVGFPAVVKPVSGTASHLVLTVSDEAGLREAYQTLAQRLPTGPLGHLYRQPLDGGPHGTIDPSTTVLVEHFLDGREFCIDLIIRDGQLETMPLVDKALLDEQYFELAFVSPPLDLSPDKEQQIRACAESAVRTLGLNNTFAHVEIIDDATLGPTIVEVNAGRPGGMAPMMLYDLTTGIDTLAEHLSVLRGAPSPRKPPKLPMPLATLVVYARQDGMLRAVHGIDEVQEHPDVITAIATRDPDTLISSDREVIVAIVIVTGFTDLADLSEMYEHIIKTVRVECDPLPVQEARA